MSGCDPAGRLRTPILCSDQHRSR